jgi:uncharacterized RDD family membrane protein YckC/cytoskeletal protein CcmA (bactofilin family)
MKMPRSLTPVVLLLLALTLAFGPALRASPAKPVESAQATPPAPEKKPDEAAPAAPPAKPSEEEPVASPAAIAEKAEEAADQATREADEPAGKIAEKTQEESTEADRKLRRHGIEIDGISVRRHGDEAPPFGDHTVAAGNKAREAISVFGNTVVDGDVSDAAVSVFGNTTVNGTVGDAAVSVFGTTTVNGTVKGEAVAVFGNIELGPQAVVEGDLTAVFGRVNRQPGATVRGNINAIGGVFGMNASFDWLHAYLTKCVLWGRPLWFGEHLGWAWLVAAGFLLFYTLIALLFPRGIERCVETVEERPGGTVLAAFLTLVLTPFLIVLLCVTVVGIAVVPFLILALAVGHFFGKAVVHAWLGRRLARIFGLALPAPALAVIFGGIFITLLYLVPVLGFLLYKLFGVLGLGIVVYRLLLSMQREKPALAATAAPGVPPVMGEGAAPVAAEVRPPRPLITADTMPRAGFWIRVAAAALDAIMIGIACGFLSSIWHGFGNAFLFWYAVYCAAMWATKGTTIGGVICGLKIVRLDDRPLDWGVAVIRALSGFLSLFVAGLGFIWVAFDHDKQSWHDKIAGTTIVRVPKGTSLL